MTGAASEAGQLLPSAAARCSRSHLGVGAAVALTPFFHGEMGVGHGGDLGQMGDAQHLLACG